MDRENSLASAGIVKDGAESNETFNKYKGLPNIFGGIAIVSAVAVFFVGLGMGAFGGLVTTIAFWCSGWLGCLFLYAVGAVVASLRQIEHNTRPH